MQSWAITSLVLAWIAVLAGFSLASASSGVAYTIFHLLLALLAISFATGIVGATNARR